MKEILIDLVKMRPPLWNYYLPLSARTPNITALLWDEVTDELKGKIIYI